MRFDPDVWPLQAARVRQKQAIYTETDWEVFPRGLADVLTWFKERYGNPPVLPLPRMALLSTIRRRSKGTICPIRFAFTIYAGTCVLSPTRFRQAATCEATSRGHFSTTWNGRTVFPSGLVSCM